MELLIDNELGVKKKTISYLELDLEAIADIEEEDTSGKTLALYFMPGGDYIDATIKALRYVAQAEPGQNQMVDWFIGEYEKVNSRKTAGVGINALRVLGLIKFDGESISITENGTEVLSENAKKVLLRQLQARIAGVVEYLAELAKRKMTFDESHEFFKQVLSTDWTTNTQSRVRVRWLESVGAIIREGPLYTCHNLQ